MTCSIVAIERPVTIALAVPNAGTYRLTLDDTGGRGGVSLQSPYGWTSSYNWHAGSRGEPSLLAALLGYGVDYVADKFRLDDDFDGARTARAIRVVLYRDHRESYAQLRDGVVFRLLSDWEHWIRFSAPKVEEPWHVFPTYTCIRPDFARFYEAAWPVLRECRADIEAVMYPNPAVAMEAS